MVLVGQHNAARTQGGYTPLAALRCTHCNRLLGRINAAAGTTVEIKCHKCGTINLIYYDTRGPERCLDDKHMVDS